MGPTPSLFLFSIFTFFINQSPIQAGPTSYPHGSLLVKHLIPSSWATHRPWTRGFSPCINQALLLPVCPLISFLTLSPPCWKSHSLLHVLSNHSAKNRPTLTERKTSSSNSLHSLKSQFNQNPSIFCDYLKPTIWF